MRRLAGIASAAVAVAALAWLFIPATAGGWQLHHVTGHLPDLQFSLTDDVGKRVQARDYHGEIILLYFGFSGCAEECPLTLARLGGVMRQLGADARRVRVLFVTVNPANDTPDVLHAYLARFDSAHMVGLTGAPQAISALAQRLRAAHQPGTLVHSGAVYVFDASGHARLLASPDDADAALAHDVRRLLHAG